MPWVYLLLALGALALALVSKSTVLTVLALLAALALLLFWVLGLLARRVEAGSRDASMMVDPLELRRLREQAEARRLAQSDGRDTASTNPSE
ncbi:MAG: hypothetical protein QM719_07390 [Thermomonas sp.]